VKKFGALFFICLTATLSAWLTEPSTETQALVAPYLLTENHPAKPILDEIFGNERVSINLKTLKNAGFKDLKLRKRGIVFARHPKLPGYVIKLICDYTGHSFNEWEKTYRKQDEHLEFIGRIQKRNQITEIIERHHFDQFITPRKWIYAIPTEIDPPQKHTIVKKFYLLVADDIDIVDAHTCYTIWKTAVDRDFVHDYFVVYREARLQDFGPPNQSFTNSGHLAFIDTKDWPDETFVPIPRPFFLYGELRDYWKELVLRHFD